MRLFVLMVTLALAKAQYCQISSSHTLCQYKGTSPSCGPLLASGLTSADKAAVVDLHNKLRSRVAMGNEIRGRPGPQPTASNMMAMTWDDELASVAQRWAEQCQFGHDQSRDVSRFKVGQNVYQTSRSRDQPVQAMLREGIMGWYDEVKDWNSRGVASYQFDSGTGHYTQMVWALTDRVGCGHVTYNNGLIRKMLVCNYGPSGNFIGSPMYQSGKPCSRCPRSSSCATLAPGLCGSTGSIQNDTVSTGFVPMTPAAMPVQPVPFSPPQRPVPPPPQHQLPPPVQAPPPPPRRPSGMSSVFLMFQNLMRPFRFLG